jgi:hypothetical protein
MVACNWFKTVFRNIPGLMKEEITMEPRIL